MLNNIGFQPQHGSRALTYQLHSSYFQIPLIFKVTD